jgi:hypothetical protein
MRMPLPNQPPLLPQDRSRMILLRMLGARLLRRAIDGWPRLEAAREQYEIALKAVGHEGRSIEVFATALAAADVVLSDDPVDSDSAAELAAQLDFASLPEAEDDLPDEQAWLNHLLSCVIPLDGVGGRNTVAAWLRQGAKFDNLHAVHDEADRVLGYYGMRIVRPKDGRAPKYVAIANRANGLERLHVQTHWSGRSGAIGGWKNAAGQLEGAQKNRFCRVAGVPGKATYVPLRLIFPDGYDDDDGPPARVRGELALDGYDDDAAPAAHRAKPAAGRRRMSPGARRITSAALCPRPAPPRPRGFNQGASRGAAGSGFGDVRRAPRKPGAADFRSDAIQLRCRTNPRDRA